MNGPRLACSLLAGALSVPTSACEGLRAIDAWVRQPPPGHRVVAGYMTLSNTGEDVVRIVRTESPDFEHSMMHETVISAGRASMRHLATLELAGGATRRFEPGGAHLMLTGPHIELDTGDARVAVQLHCETGHPLTVWLPVRRQAPAATSPR